MTDVWVLDSSALIQMKKSIKLSDQWSAFKSFEALVASGEIALCRHVIREVSEITHPDLPGAWVAAMRPTLCYALDPGYEHVAAVMAAASDLVDASKTREDADPYVIAQAIHLSHDGHVPTVVTRDEVDRLPIKIAMTTACARLSVACCHLDDFLDSVSVAHSPTPGRPTGP